ncbi:AN1-type zinc finger protein 2A [Perkinsus chesapeaki]|uniref:AN1-type zinc finger protein 2A n=1 Tax=Perkinsus chesapeaki TaxID=330153 RepID=A0A7J6MFE7_PERCH|nr:AN1-type zinc finger protein 2A [Perkinsus chesapeaki]
MTDFADLGAHCAEPYCHQQDFLPFECDRCHKEFCLDHRTYEAHNCPYLNSTAYNKQQVIICPLCRASIHLLSGETENEAFQRHSNSTECRPENYNKPRLQKCPVEGCRERLTEVNSYECPKCHTKICLKHRYEDAHPCEEWRARGPSKLFKRNSGKPGSKKSAVVASSGSKAGSNGRSSQWRCRKCRTVRKILDKDVLPGLPKPLATCAFSPGNDIWSPHEKAKVWRKPKQSSSTWQCGICGKVFKSEHYLDLHMEGNHMDIANEDGVCLADYCGIFRVCHGTPSTSEPRPAPEFSSRMWTTCDEDELTLLRDKCSAAVESCYNPRSSDEDHRMAYATLYRTHCSMLSCGARYHELQELESAPFPTAAVLLALAGVTIILFFSMLICVDCGCGEEIAAYLSDRWQRRFVKHQQALRVKVGASRVKQI